MDFIDFLSDPSNRKLLYMFKVESKGEKTFFLSERSLISSYPILNSLTQTNTNLIEVLKRDLEVLGLGAQQRRAVNRNKFLLARNSLYRIGCSLLMSSHLAMSPITNQVDTGHVGLS